MKTRVILYVVRDTKDVGGVRGEELTKALDISADRVKIVMPAEVDAGVADAWWRLTAQCMNRIVCMIAQVTQNCEIRLTGRELRLCW